MVLNLSYSDAEIGRFRRLPSKTILAAKNGSLSSTNIVSERLNEIPKALQRDATDMFLGHLRKPHVPCADLERGPLQDNVAFCLGFSALLGIIKICTETSSESYTRLLQRMVVNEWQHILRWIESCHDAANLPHVAIEEEEALIATLSAIFSSIASLDSIAGAFLSELIAFECAARLWLEDFERPPLQQGYCSTSAVTQCLTYSKDIQKTLLRFSKLGASAETVATLALKRLKDATAHVEADGVEYAVVCSKMISMIVWYPNSPFYEPIFLHHGIKSMMLASLGLATCIGRLDENNPGTSGVRSGMIFLAYALSNPAAERSWIKQALRNGLLETLAILSSKLRPVSAPGDRLTQAVVSFLTEILPPHLIRPSVLELAVVGMETSGSSELLLPLDNSDLGMAWRTFDELLLERATAKNLFERTEPRIDTDRCCNNRRCKKRSDFSEIFKCAGCNAALYCSRSCQIESWKGEHRQQCKAASKLLELDDFPRLNTRDREFVRKLATRDIRLHKLRAARKRSETPTFDTDTIFMSYARHPPFLLTCDDEDMTELWNSGREGSNSVALEMALEAREPRVESVERPFFIVIDYAQRKSEEPFDSRVLFCWSSNVKCDDMSRGSKMQLDEVETLVRDLRREDRNDQWEHYSTRLQEILRETPKREIA